MVQEGAAKKKGKGKKGKKDGETSQESLTAAERDEMMAVQVN